MNTAGDQDVHDRISKLNSELPGFQSDYGLVLNWIHHEVDQTVLKDELIILAQKMGKRSAAESIPTNRVGVEGSIAYCINRGAMLAPSSMARVQRVLDAAENATEEKAPDWEHISETPQSRIIRAYVECYSRIDNAKTRVIKGKLERRDLAPEIRRIVGSFGQGKNAVIKMLCEHYKDSYTEAQKDPTISDWVKPLATIAEALFLMVGNRDSIRAGAKGAKARKLTRTIGQVDRKGEKAASKVTYKDEDDQLGIRSVDPTNVVGADAAVVYNTKNRHCEIYLAKPGSKLSVHGARIVNFDDATSLGKILRHPESDLPHWTRASTIKRFEVLMKGIKGKRWEVTGKLNRNTMILKVM
jgi:hypothetical protein